MIPVSATKYSFLKIFSGKSGLRAGLTEHTGADRCFFFRRGTEALYVLFKALMKVSERNTVIIPSYTADAVYAAAVQAGLRVNFCDMSLQSFNMDLTKLESVVDEDTLAVVGVHLFGIPEDMERISGILKGRGVFLVDDLCQAFGSRLRGCPVGAFGDAAVLSFGKGKNFTTVEGGALLTREGMISDLVSGIYEELEDPGVLANLKYLAMSLGLSILARPFPYTYARRLFADKREVPVEFSVVPGKLTGTQLRLGSGLMRDIDNIISARKQMGLQLYDALAGMEGLTLPEIAEKDVAWNRLPVMVKDADKREVLRDLLLDDGVEANYYYNEPCYFDLTEGFAGIYRNASYFAGHLLTLPSNVFLTDEAIGRIAHIFQDILD